jgi:hypothetical protein
VSSGSKGIVEIGSVGARSDLALGPRVHFHNAITTAPATTSSNSSSRSFPCRRVGACMFGDKWHPIHIVVFLPADMRDRERERERSSARMCVCVAQDSHSVWVPIFPSHEGATVTCVTDDRMDLGVRGVCREPWRPSDQRLTLVPHLV